MAKGDRWSDDPNVKVREMRSAETALGVIREREFQAETTGERLEIERLTSSLEGGGGNRTQPVSRKGLRTPAQADTSPAAYPTVRTVRRGLRHEATDVPVLTGLITRTEPSVRPLVPYQDVRPEQSGGAKLLGQRILTRTGWPGLP